MEAMQFMKKHKGISLISLLILILLSTVVFLRNSPYRERVLHEPVVQHFVHTYFSLRKMGDIFFFPYLFVKNKLPVYSLSISPENIAALNEALPDDPLFGHLEDENKIYVNGDFFDPATLYQDQIKVRYRGLFANHWNGLKKSLRIEFPDEHFLNGMRSVDFVTPYDRAYFATPLTMYRAEKLGLINLDMSFVRLNINGSDTGVYLMFEHWSPELLAKKGLPETPLYGVQDETDIPKLTPAFYKDFTDKEDLGINEEIKAFLEVLLSTDDKMFSRLIPEIFNMDAFYSWNILNILSGTNHQDETNNTILYWNGVTGKFEMIPWDLNIGGREDRPYDDTFSILARRIFSEDSFREARNKKLEEYLRDDTELIDDLAFFDELAASTKRDFLKDTYKLHSNFKFLKEIKTIRELITINWENTKKLLQNLPDYEYVVGTTEPHFEGSFQNISELSDSMGSFLAKNPSFYSLGERSLGLSGDVILRRDVSLPPGVNLTIFPGTRVFLDHGVSIVVRGQLRALGTKESPVSLRRLYPADPWGTLLVLNAKTSTSSVSFLEAEGGSGDRINGITATGMVAFHNSDVTITSSQFIGATDDDALNVKMAGGNVRWSYFSSNLSDGIDVDFAKKDFELHDNVFKNNGGDAIDLSFSDIKIENNTIDVCGDKGISVGERSNPKIMGNKISNCLIGIAVKDQSNALIENNEIKNNDEGVSLYKKKEEFGGAFATLVGNLFDGNAKDTLQDEFSFIDLP